MYADLCGMRCEMCFTEQSRLTFVRLRVNKQKMKELVNEYTLLWRGLLGTEYAAQTSGLFGR